MQLNLEQIQPTVVSILKAHSLLAPFCVDPATIVLSDDGNYPKAPEREALLSDVGKGLCITVWQIQPGPTYDASLRGTTAVGIYVPVVVEENVKLNRTASGTQIPIEKAIQGVLSALVGKPTAALVKSTHVFTAQDPAFVNFGRVEGVLKSVVNLEYPFTIVPSN